MLIRADRLFAPRAGSRDAAQTLSECRAAALRRLFPKLAPWREAAADGRARARVEALLLAADDLDDLHRRMARLQRVEPSARRAGSDALRSESALCASALEVSRTVPAGAEDFQGGMHTA